MSGETNLQTLLRNMQPKLRDGEFVYCTLAPNVASGMKLTPVGQFLEDEGVTVILAKAEAEANGLAFVYPCKLITLNIHSSLQAVGLLAAVTAALAERGISVNAISAYFHDHLFVPITQAEEALQVLKELARRAA